MMMMIMKSSVGHICVCFLLEPFGGSICHLTGKRVKFTCVRLKKGRFGKG